MIVCWSIRTFTQINNILYYWFQNKIKNLNKPKQKYILVHMVKVILNWIDNDFFDLSFIKLKILAAVSAIKS